MTGSNQYRRGFGTVGIILTLVVVLAIGGGVGFFVLNKRVEKNSANAETTTPPPATPPQANTKPTPATVAPAGAVLTVKEWGIQLSLPQSIKDAYYVQDVGNDNMMFIGLTSLDNEKCKATSNPTGGTPLATLLRLRPNDTEPVTGERYVDKYKQGTQIGDFYYVYAGWHRTAGNDRNVCGSDEALNGVDNAFNAAIRTAKPINGTATVN